MKKARKVPFVVQAGVHIGRYMARHAAQAVALFRREFHLSRSWRFRADERGGWRGVSFGVCQ